EFPSPNTNKPLHLGHLRNMSIGESVSRILEFSGEKVIRANLNNDRGIHICKSMTAYEKFGKDKKPGRKKSDHFVGDFYVLYNKKLNDKLKSRAQEILQLWEKGDKKIHALWKKMNNWALEGFKETYDKFGIHHDIEFFESNLYKKGKNIVEKGLKNGIFEKTKDGAIKINLEKEKLGEKVLMRKDGTSVYMTQDLYLAKLKFEKYKIDKSIYVVGNEQNYHFNVLFSILRKLGFKKQMYHLSYGMVELPEGKMKSREGNVVDADNLIKDVQKLVKKELNKREKLSKKELEKRSLIISLASIKYMLLKTDIKKNMLFNPKESVSFEGNAGPYLLYTYARSCSILKKAKNYSSNIKIKNLEKQENKLLTKLNNFTDIFSKAKENLNPFLIANYSYELCKTFNEFYHSCPVINSDNENFRLLLVDSFRHVLKNSLYLL
ncbi:MAG: arginine--tRNA ligase, partial [Nanoarchaeota archaeon]